MKFSGKLKKETAAIIEEGNTFSMKLPSFDFEGSIF